MLYNIYTFNLYNTHNASTAHKHNLLKTFHRETQKATYFNKFNLVRLCNKTKIQYVLKCALWPGKSSIHATTTEPFLYNCDYQLLNIKQTK